MLPQFLVVQSNELRGSIESVRGEIEQCDTKSNNRIDAIELSMQDILGVKVDNIFAEDNIANVSNMSCDNFTDYNGIYTGTPNKSYGRIDFIVDKKFDNIGKDRYFLVTYIMDSPIVNNNVVAYLYNDGANLKNMKNMKLSSSVAGSKYLYYTLCKTDDSQTEFDRIVIGLMNGLGNTYSVTKRSLVVINCTEYYPDKMDFKDLCGLVTDYFEYTFIKETDTEPIFADDAEHAKESDIAAYLVGKNNILYSSEYTYADNEATNWFYRLIDLTIEPNHKYLCCVSTENESDIDKSNGMGIINKSGKWEICMPWIKISHEYQNYAVVATTDESNTLSVQFKSNTESMSWIKIKVYDVTDLDTVDSNIVISLLNEKDKYSASDIIKMIPVIKPDEEQTTVYSDWMGKNVLVIGDSLTAAMKWQTILNSYLGMNVTTHAKGGMGITQCVDGENGAGEYDNETAASGTLYALNVNDVSDKDLIIYFAGYNNRGTEDGNVGDCYNPETNTGRTIAGMTQYVINRIYEELKEADNLKCRVILVTPHCAGKYSYIDADGYDEWPSGSGRTMQTLANIQEEVCAYNNIPCYNAWKNSGINKNTWCVYAYSPVPDSGKTEQGSGGKYYWNADQLHLCTNGYYHLGMCIAKFVLTI